MKLSAIPRGYIVYDPPRPGEPAVFVVLGCPHPDGHSRLNAAERCASKLITGKYLAPPKTLRRATA